MARRRLARPLAPDDFGLITMATMVIDFINSFVDLGHGALLMRQHQATRDHCDTAWTFSFLRGIVVAIFLAAIAPWVADYFRLAKASEYLNFSMVMIPLNIAHYFTARVGAFVVGRMGSAAALGVYNIDSYRRFQFDALLRSVRRRFSSGALASRAGGIGDDCCSAVAPPRQSADAHASAHHRHSNRRPHIHRHIAGAMASSGAPGRNREPRFVDGSVTTEVCPEGLNYPRAT